MNFQYFFFLFLLSPYKHCRLRESVSFQSIQLIYIFLSSFNMRYFLWILGISIKIYPKNTYKISTFTRKIRHNVRSTHWFFIELLLFLHCPDFDPKKEFRWRLVSSWNVPQILILPSSIQNVPPFNTKCSPPFNTKCSPFQYKMFPLPYKMYSHFPTKCTSLPYKMYSPFYAKCTPPPLQNVPPFHV